MNTHDLIRENERLKQRIETLENEKADLEILMELGSEHGDFVIKDIIQELKTTKKEFLKKINVYTDPILVFSGMIFALRPDCRKSVIFGSE